MTVQSTLDQFEFVTCNICGSSTSELVIEGPDRNYGSPGIFRVVRCSKCGLVYTNPRPRLEALELYYPTNYGPHNRAVPVPNVSRSWLERIKDWIKQGVADKYYYHRLIPGWKALILLPFAIWFRMLRVILLPSPAPNARLLDIGCSTGAFLSSLVGQWPELYGIEPDMDAASQAKQINGLNIHAGTLESARFPDAFFDVVVLWHVLEHVPNPNELLSEIRRILKSGGHVVLMSPNIATFEFKVFGINWKGLDLPRHFYHFSPRSVHQMLMEAGLSVLRITVQIEPAIIEASLLNFLNSQHRDISAASWRFMRFLLWPLSALLAWRDSSGVLVAYGRRDIER